MKTLDIESSKNRIFLDNQEKVEELGKIIQTLDTKLQEDKLWYQSQIKEKDEQLNKKSPREA